MMVGVIAVPPPPSRFPLGSDDRLSLSLVFFFCITIFLGPFSGFFGSRFRHQVYVMYILTASVPFLACHLSLYTHALTSLFYLVFPSYINRTPCDRDNLPFSRCRHLSLSLFAETSRPW